MYHSTYIKPEP